MEVRELARFTGADLDRLPVMELRNIEPTIIRLAEAMHPGAEVRVLRSAESDEYVVMARGEFEASPAPLLLLAST